MTESQQNHAIAIPLLKTCSWSKKTHLRWHLQKLKSYFQCLLFPLKKKPINLVNAIIEANTGLTRKYCHWTDYCRCLWYCMRLPVKYHADSNWMVIMKTQSWHNLGLMSKIPWCHIKNKHMNLIISRYACQWIYLLVGHSISFSKQFLCTHAISWIKVVHIIL